MHAAGLEATSRRAIVVQETVLLALVQVERLELLLTQSLKWTNYGYSGLVYFEPWTLCTGRRR
jgi:hypothetical protein